MSPDLDAGEFDDQDQAEVFDEDNTNLDEVRTFGGEDVETLEELPDVYDVTSALGDEDDDAALIGEDLDDQDIIDLEQDLDDEDDKDQDPEFQDGLAASSADEVELEYVGDLTDLAHARSAAQPFESRTLSDADLRDLHYSEAKDHSMDGLPRTPRENDVENIHDKPLDPEVGPDDLPEGHPKRRQEELLDEGVEETFPASDPVSVKRIT
jgi:hypothetical protein